MSKSKEIKDLPKSKDVDEDWPKKGRDYYEVDGKFYWAHEKIPLKAFSRERMKRREKQEKEKPKKMNKGGLVKKTKWESKWG
jgi:hypothetical protein